MTKNTTKVLKVDRVLGEWCIIALSRPQDNDGTVWLRGFESKEQAELVAARLRAAVGSGPAEKKLRYIVNLEIEVEDGLDERFIEQFLYDIIERDNGPVEVLTNADFKLKEVA